jgi:hypothetical protein
MSNKDTVNDVKKRKLDITVSDFFLQIFPRLTLFHIPPVVHVTF